MARGKKTTMFFRSQSSPKMVPQTSSSLGIQIFGMKTPLHGKPDLKKLFPSSYSRSGYVQDEVCVMTLAGYVKLLQTKRGMETRLSHHDITMIKH